MSDEALVVLLLERFYGYACLVTRYGGAYYNSYQALEERSLGSSGSPPSSAAREVGTSPTPGPFQWTRALSRHVEFWRWDTSQAGFKVSDEAEHQDNSGWGSKHRNRKIRQRIWNRFRTSPSYNTPISTISEGEK